MPSPRATPIALVACRVLQSEIAALRQGATHIVRQELLEVGLHDQSSVLRTKLGEAIARAESDPVVEAVVLGYGLCGLALTGLSPRRCPLIVPRAHDCLTLFLGSKERYAACMREEPGTYWYSPGWNRERRVAGPEREAKLREEYGRRFDPEEAQALIEMERATFAQYTTAGYTDLRVPGDDTHRTYAEECARSLGWRFRDHGGDPALLRALLFGPWDSGRFLVLAPGERIAHTTGSEIVMAIPSEP